MPFIHLFIYLSFHHSLLPICLSFFFIPHTFFSMLLFSCLHSSFLPLLLLPFSLSSVPPLFTLSFSFHPSYSYPSHPVLPFFLVFSSLLKFLSFFSAFFLPLCTHLSLSLSSVLFFTVFYFFLSFILLSSCTLFSICPSILYFLYFPFLLFASFLSSFRSFRCCNLLYFFLPSFFSYFSSFFHFLLFSCHNIPSFLLIFSIFVLHFFLSSLLPIPISFCNSFSISSYCYILPLYLPSSLFLCIFSFLSSFRFLQCTLHRLVSLLDATLRCFPTFGFLLTKREREG